MENIYSNLTYQSLSLKESIRQKKGEQNRHYILSLGEKGSNILLSKRADLHSVPCPHGTGLNTLFKLLIHNLFIFLRAKQTGQSVGRISYLTQPGVTTS